MRLNPDSYFENLSKEDLIKRFTLIGEVFQDTDFNELKEKLKKYERTRCIQLWHDGSSITNHGHILFCINILYDPAVFYSSHEYEEKFGFKVNVQALVETPELYIIGRCGNNDEQLAYIKTRVDCLEDLKKGLNLGELDENYQGIKLFDTLRFFHGDGPAAALEAGNQKGGHYFCVSCDVHSCYTDDIEHCYKKKPQSLAEKQHLVICGKYGKINSVRRKTLPFKTFENIRQLQDELRSRNISIDNVKPTKKDLVPKLIKALRGVKRVPIIMLNSPLTDFDQMGLARYEISMVECMHDISCHIDNLLEELPHHLKPNDKLKVNEILDIYKAEKQQKRCCDKRKILLQLTRSLNFQIDGHVHKLLRSLSEIQRILYLDDDFRTTKEILRLHNACFEHFILLKQVMPIKNLSAKMSRDKMYGKYMHNLLVHAPLQYRLVSGSSINVENEERLFTTIKTITKNTSNNHPGHLIGNLIVRQAVESECDVLFEHGKSPDQTLNDIHFLGVGIYKNERNSLFTHAYIPENNSDWQAHLQRISDYLAFGETVWWERNEFGVEFYDYDKMPQDPSQHPKVHHFRSSMIPDVVSELEGHWTYICQNEICIPTHTIPIENQDEIDHFVPSTKMQCHQSSSLVDDDGEVSTSAVSIAEDRNDITDFEISFPDDLNSDEAVYHDDEGGPEHSLNNANSSVIELGSSSVVVNIPPFNNKVNAYKTGSSKGTTACRFYSSSEAFAIFSVLGGSPELIKYDIYKTAFKQGKSSHYDVESLKDSQTNFQQQILQKVLILQEQFKNWEKSFFVNNSLCAPTEKDICCNNEISEILKKIKIGNQLLRRWNISF